jgi:hypothetical protein
VRSTNRPVPREFWLSTSYPVLLGVAMLPCWRRGTVDGRGSNAPSLGRTTWSVSCLNVQLCSRPDCFPGEASRNRPRSVLPYQSTSQFKVEAAPSDASRFATFRELQRLRRALVSRLPHCRYSWSSVDDYCTMDRTDVGTPGRHLSWTRDWLVFACSNLFCVSRSR